MGRSDFHDSPARRTDSADPATARTFADQAISGPILIDNAIFENCRFQKAVLIYTGGVPPQLRGCIFDNVAFEFQGPAGRTLAFLQAMSTPASGLRDIVKASFGRIFGH